MTPSTGTITATTFNGKATDADKLDGRDSSEFMFFSGVDTNLGSASPAATAKTYWSNAEDKMITGAYNPDGIQYSLLFSKNDTSGSILKWGYGDKYLRILRNQTGTWKSTDWEKVDAGNADTATKFASSQSIALTGDITGSASSQAGWSIATTIGEGKVTNAMLAGSIANSKLSNSKVTIAGNDVNLGGSLSASTLVSSLGLSNALHYLGKTTTALYEGATTNSVVVNGVAVTPSAGDVVIDNGSPTSYSTSKTYNIGDRVFYDSKVYECLVNGTTGTWDAAKWRETQKEYYEYVWNGSAWERLGGDSSFKIVQSAVESPTASGSGIQYIATISQDPNGVITATKSTVRDASDSQSGVVSTGEQTFAGKKTFNGQVIFANSSDADGSTENSGSIFVGAINGQHLAIDSNEIMAKSNGTTASTLYLNNDGGAVRINNRLRFNSNKISYADANDNVKDMITMVDGNANGHGIKIGGGALTVVGAGESAASCTAAGTLETLFLLSDGVINVEANANTYANRIGFQVTAAGAVIPVKAEAGNNNAQTLGTSTYKWSNVYSTTFTGSLAGNASSASKLTTENVGGAKQPIYFANGVPVQGAINYVFFEEVTIN